MSKFSNHIFSIKRKFCDKAPFTQITILGIKIKIKCIYNVKKIHDYYSSVKNNIKTKDKLTVVFLVRENSKWTYDSLYNLMQKSPLFEPIVAVSLLLETAKGQDVTRDDLEKNYNFFKSQGYNVVQAYDPNSKKFIDLKHFNADIVFYDQLWDLPFIHRPEHVCKYALTYYSSYSYEICNDRANYKQDFHKYLNKYFVEHQDNIKRYKKYKRGNNKNCLVVGYPKLDVYLDKTEIDEKQIWKDPEKIKIIYAPHHSFEKYGLRFATFQKNGKFLLDFAKNHPETTWIFKPHPRFKYACLKNNIFTEEELEKYYTDWEMVGRIYDTGNYFDIFKTSDLMITDSCSFLAEYLPTNKPLIRPINKHAMKLNQLGNRIVSAYLPVYNNAELENTLIDIIGNNIDAKAKSRQKTVNEIIDFKESASEKILKFIISDVRGITI